MRRLTYKHTVGASFTSAFVQALVVNFVPLLYLTFQRNYGLSLSQLSLLVTVNFVTQLTVDALSSKLVDVIGVRPCLIASQVFVALGLAGLAFLPGLIGNAFVGIILCTIVFATGGGIIEVMCNPVIKSCPLKNKTRVLSFSHAMYCWGTVVVIVLSTVFFVWFGIKNWKIMALIWSVIPAINAVMYCIVPLFPITESGKSLPFKKLFASKLFWLFLLLMLCAGAAEVSVAQWASAFAESGLKVSKTLGDLLGPCLFAVMMGTARMLYGKFNHKFSVKKALLFCSALCVASYLLIAFAPWAWMGFVGLTLCGFSTGILWPAVCAVAGEQMPAGGTAMFALLALAGDVGCVSGPALVGVVSDALNGAIGWGILAAIVFPILMTIGVLMMRETRKEKVDNEGE